MNHTLRRFPDAGALATEAATRWLDAVAGRHSFTIALSGGRIPKLLYAAVAAEAPAGAFEKVHFFWQKSAIEFSASRGHSFIRAGRFYRRLLYDVWTPPKKNLLIRK